VLACVWVAATLGCGSDSDAAGSGGAGGTGGAAGSSGSGGGSGGKSADNIVGSLGGKAMDAQGSTASFTEVTDRAYVSLSISEWAADCKTTQLCEKAQINFTLHALLGKLADVKPGTYSVGDSKQGGLDYELVGAAGRYDASCGAGFAGLASGTVTFTAMEPRVIGSLDLVLEDSTTLQGSFDAVVCTTP
jgi:hypothetical protein